MSHRALSTGDPYETHPRLRRLARSFLAIPFAKPVARRATSFAIQRLPFSRKNKERLYNLLAVDAASDNPIACQVRIPSGNRLLVRLDLTDRVSRGWYYWGYEDPSERSTFLLWTHLIGKATTVFDVGANIGVYTLLAAARLQGRGAVHSFEPNPEVFSWLTHNASLNGFVHARIAQLALSDSDGNATFFIPKNRDFAVGSLIKGFAHRTSPVVVETMRFDTYCTRFDIGKVDLIKIDVEGAELKVLTGMGQLLHKWKPDIICEILEGFASALNEFFDNTPYRKFLITSDGLQETSALRPHREFRDYYLSCAPLMDARPF